MADRIDGSTQLGFPAPSAEKDREKRDAERAKRRKTFIRRVAKVLTGFVVVSFTATEAMMFILFGRTDTISSRPFDMLIWASERDYRSRALEFMSGSNKLKGYYVLPPNPRALILLVHGVRTSSDSLTPVVQYFVENAYAVMTFDGTACGRSEGTTTVGLQQQRYDIRSALVVIRQDPEISQLPLALVGHSAGAYGVAVEAARSKAVAAVCVSGFESPLGTMYFWANRYASMLSNVEYPFLWIREHAAKGSDANESGSDALRSASVPALVIHGQDDDVVSPEISLYQAIVRKGAANVRTTLVTDSRFSNHSNILVSEASINRDVLDQVLRFLDPLVRQP